MHPLTRPIELSGPARRHALRHFRAVVFDMDGVVTDTAGVHARAWKDLFDSCLPAVGALPQNEAAVAAAPRALRPFDERSDYLEYVDGKPREDGVRSFFASRGLLVPEAPGTPAAADAAGTPAAALTVQGLAERKQGFFEEVLHRDGVTVFPEALSLLTELRQGAVPTALVTSSRNSAAVLGAGHVERMFDVVVDGNTALERGLPGKPDPAMFLLAAQQLGVEPVDAIVLEDAASGVQAARDGGFGLVVGVDRALDPQRLKDAGADVVVEDFSTLHLGQRTTRPFDPNWVLAYDHFDPAEEGTREALCTLANGYWGTRGSVPGTTAGTTHYPGTYVAGVFNRLQSTVQGKTVETEHMVNAPDWTYLRVTLAGGDQLLPDNPDLISYRQELDLRRGLLTRTMRFRDDRGRTTRVSTRQFQSFADHHLAALELTVEAEDWSGTATVRSLIDGRVANQNVADDRELASDHWEPVDARETDGETVLLETVASQSRVHVALSSRTRFQSPSDAPEPVRTPVELGSLVIGHDIEIALAEGVPVMFDKITAAANTHDHATSTVWHNAVKRVERSGSFRQMLTFHEEMWGVNWSRFAVRLDPAPELQGHLLPPATRLEATEALVRAGTTQRHQLALNLHTFHVLQTSFGSRSDLDAGLGARGLHGEGYRGHIFWDEIFVYPMLTLRRPDLTRGLLMYRYRRLGEARANALAEGYRGAMFPWQSGSDGREETPTELWNERSGQWMPDNSHNQRHVSLAVAYSVLRYVEATQDQTFVSDYGAEMLVEICRFFVSMAHYNPERGRYELHGVMGPDEYHDGYPDTPGSGVRNNAYTNVLLSWVLSETVRLVQWLDGLDDPLTEWLDVFEDELAQWADMSLKLRVPFQSGGVMSQFDGYEDLEEFDWAAYRDRYGNIGRLDLILQAEGDSTNHYKLSKQADVLMLAYLFSSEELQGILNRMGYHFTSEDFTATVDYYLARTSHGSTLSRLVHGWVAARTDRSSSWELFEEALEADLSDTQGGTTREGIHLGAMAGTVDMVIRCYAGVETRSNTLWLHPLLPLEVPGVQFTIRFRRQPLSVRITQYCITLQLLEGSAHPIHLNVEGREKTMHPGEKWTVPLLNRNAALTASVDPMACVSPEAGMLGIL
ncbi:beta-phosphoglucomutase family hydrolase [Citricoccus sp. NPDC055426]|uniref:beta-phosphoglucomutase family hydrolase n=1 Tax=Citricoccus sp. NPDC055426 TaxID=3155536 RepID=UPI00342B8E0E